jgi:dynein assembly factor with WDR repeat domains 1
MSLDFIRYYFVNAGHEKDISKITFNPQGTKVLTAGFDQIARLWDSETGELLQ